MTDRAIESGVLLVEDEALIAFEAEDALHDLGYADVTVCGTYESAEKAIESGAFGLGVFDVNLNGRMSLPLIERFTERGGRAVMTTGYEIDKETVAGLGAIHLPKPYTPDGLRAAVADALARSTP